MPPSPSFMAEKLEAIASFRDFCLGKAIPAYPVETFIEVSNVCDLKCTMCTDFSGANPARGETIRAKKRGLVEADAIARFDSLLRHALSVHCFGGGEPTIHPEFRRILDHIAGYEVLIDFFTHGMHLDPDLAAFLVDRGVHKITVSLSGATEEVYRQYYLGGDFGRVLAGIRRVADLKRASGSPYPIIEINSLGFRPHVAAFDAFVAMMAEHGADVVHLKQLQRWPHLRHVHPHVSIFRPWVEGEVLARAAAAGKRLGVHVSADQYVGQGVASEAEYQRRLAEIEAEMGADSPAPVRPPEAVSPARVLGLGENKAVVRALFAVKEVPAAGYYCMEPFKTLFTTRNGHVRPCCFHNHWSWHLGDATEHDPVEIWNGVGYGVVREAILEGKYPVELCGPCLAKRLGPGEHGVHDQIRAYIAWHRSRFGPVLGEALACQAPNALNDIAEARADVIVARFDGRAVVGEPAGDVAIPDGLPAVPMLDHTVAPVIEGNLERIGDEVVGWVWSPLMPGRRLPVSVWQGQRLLARATADIMRDDLLTAGKGDGAHGFHILLPIADPEMTVTVGDSPDRLRFHAPTP